MIFHIYDPSIIKYDCLANFIGVTAPCWAFHYELKVGFDESLLDESTFTVALFISCQNFCLALPIVFNLHKRRTY